MGETKQSQKQAKADVDAKLELAVPSRELLEELAVACAKDPSPDNTFQYAFCLSKSRERSELRYAVTILDGLVKEGYEHQVDCMYGSATALYLLEEYDQARVRLLSLRNSARLIQQFSSGARLYLEEEWPRCLPFRRYSIHLVSVYVVLLTIHPSLSSF